MAEQLESLNQKVLLDHQVTVIEQLEDHVLLSTSNGEKFRGKYVIVTVPPPHINKISYRPMLPAQKDQLYSVNLVLN